MRIGTQFQKAFAKPLSLEQKLNVWHFDTECIEGHSDYGRITAQMAEMMQGSLTLHDIRGHVDRSC